MSTLAMIDPAAGAGGAMILLALFIVAPISFLCSLTTRKWLIPTAVITLMVATLLLIPWLWLDAFVPGRRWLSLRLMLIGIGMSLVSSLIAGLPGWAIAECIARCRRPTAEHSVDRN